MLFAGETWCAAGEAIDELGLGAWNWFDLDDAVVIAQGAGIQCAASALAALRYATLSDGYFDHAGLNGAITTQAEDNIL